MTGRDGEVRFTTHRSARCPWCRGPVVRDDRCVDGYLRRMVVCLAEDTCGWAALLDGPAAITEDVDNPTGHQ